MPFFVQSSFEPKRLSFPATSKYMYRPQLYTFPCHHHISVESMPKRVLQITWQRGEPLDLAVYPSRTFLDLPREFREQHITKHSLHRGLLQFPL